VIRIANNFIKNGKTYIINLGNSLNNSLFKAALNSGNGF
jgi:hypothetical protein